MNRTLGPSAVRTSALIALLALAGCGGTRTDSRLHGHWEGRRGFNSTIRVGFNPNGTTTIKTSDDHSTETVTGYWSVVKPGAGQLTIRIKQGITGSYQQRKVKFISDDRIELIAADGKRTRLSRMRRNAG